MAAANYDVTLEGVLPVVNVGGLNTNRNINFNGGSNTCDLPASTTINGVTVATNAITSSATTGTMFSVTNTGVYTGAGVVSITGNSATTGDLLAISGTAQTTGAGLVIKTSSSNALVVGLNGKTNPAFQVDSSTASQAAGLKVTGAATGGTVAVVAIDSGANTSVTVNAKGTGTIGIGTASTGQINVGRGALSAVIFGSTTAALGTVQNSTPTAAQLLGGVVTQTSATGAGTVTFPTGTLLSGAVSNVAVNDSFDCVFANLGGGFTLTLTGAVGMSIIGNGAVPSGKNAFMTFVNTGANTWNVYVVVSA